MDVSGQATQQILGSARLLLVALAAFELVRAQLWLARSSDGRVLTMLRSAGDAEMGFTGSDRDRRWIEGVRWAIEGLSRRLPGRTDCLVQVTAAHRILTRRRLSHTIEIEVGQLPSGGFESHVWLACAGIVFGGGAHPDLTRLDVPRD